MSLRVTSDLIWKFVDTHRNTLWSRKFSLIKVFIVPIMPCVSHVNLREKVEAALHHRLVRPLAVTIAAERFQMSTKQNVVVK